MMCGSLCCPAYYWQSWWASRSCGILRNLKRYICEFNRDDGWQVIRGAGFDSVRQVAIDEDWSALRFRRVEYIKAAASLK